MYICFIQEFREPWTYWRTCFTILLSSLNHSSSYLTTCVLRSIKCFCYHLLRFFPRLEWWSFVIQCMEDCHTLLPSLSHPMDIGSEIVSRESHLVRESSCTSVFESISIYYIFLIRVHLLTFRVCTCKKKRKKSSKKKWRKKERKRISTCMFVYNVFLHWVCV